MESNEGEGKTEKLFQNFGKKVDKFLEELDEAGGKLNKEFEGRFEELKQTAEKFKNDAENKERWKEVEESLKKAGKELENAVKAAFKKK
jgi:predicted phage gp36 major capsid-like protein